VNDFKEVHAVGYPCVSGEQGQGNAVNDLFDIASHITVLVITPDRQIAGQFYGPDYLPAQDTLNSLLLSLGADMMDCSVGINEHLNQYDKEEELFIYPNPVIDNSVLRVKIDEADWYQIQVINALGELESSQRAYFLKGENTINMQNSMKSAGMYYIKLQNKNRIFSTKLLKQ